MTPAAKTRCSASRSPEPRRGAVLLVVLAVLVVAGVALTTLARRSLRATQDAAAALDDLQHRWGERSIVQTLLPEADRLFKRRDELRKLGAMPGQSPSRFAVSVTLGRHRFDVVVADEDAKANLNTVYDFAGGAAVEDVLEIALGPVARPVVALQPQRPSAGLIADPAANADDDIEEDIQGDDERTAPPEPELPPALASWGDVLNIVRLRQQTGDDRQLATATARLTLFGSGRLNARRADADTIKAVAGAAVTEGLASRVADAILEDDSAEVAIILRKIVKNDDDRALLTRLINQGSQSYSLWIESTGPGYRQQSFRVRRVDADGDERRDRFVL